MRAAQISMSTHLIASNSLQRLHGRALVSTEPKTQRTVPRIAMEIYHERLSYSHAVERYHSSKQIIDSTIDGLYPSSIVVKKEKSAEKKAKKRHRKAKKSVSPSLTPPGQV
jgi:hypothetical protein